MHRCYVSFPNGIAHLEYAIQKCMHIKEEWLLLSCESHKSGLENTSYTIFNFGSTQHAAKIIFEHIFVEHNVGDFLFIKERYLGMVGQLRHTKFC